MDKKTRALKLALDVLTPDPEEAFWFVEKKKEKAITAIREALAEQPAQELLAWKNAAIRVGEELSSVGPNGYYNMTADQWLAWAMDQQPRGKSSLAEQPAQPQEPDYKALWQQMCERCDELDAKLARQQEPHGWYIDGYGAVLGAAEPNSVRPGEWLPFYTSPPAQHQCRFPLCHNEEYQQALAEQIKRELYTGHAAQRKPLTDECLFDIADEYKSEYKHGGQRYDEFDFKGYARAIEAAHGITGEQK